MSDRETALRNLAVGDVFHARSRNGASLVCLVIALDDGTLHARRIHTQDDVQFDRNTGVDVDTPHTRIDCVAPLPPDIHTIFAAMDRRYEAAHALIRQGIEVNLDEARWTEDERRAHSFLKKHIAANLIDGRRAASDTSLVDFVLAFYQLTDAGLGRPDV
jgi:hypothetical protein